jgi:hypothetical protein
VGSYSANYNGMDLQGTFNTGGGDFYAAGKTFVERSTNWDINATLGNIVVNAGAGNITFVGNRIDFGGVYTAGKTTTVNTTGVLTIRPFDSSFGYTFNVAGAVNASGHWVGTGTSATNNGTGALIIQNVATLGGLTIGKNTNTRAVQITNGITVAGDVNVYGGQIAIAAAQTVRSTAGNVLLDADVGSQLSFNGVGLLMNTGATVRASGNLSILGRGGSTVNAANYGVSLIDADLIAGGNISVSGVTAMDRTIATFIQTGSSLQAGGSLTLSGLNQSTTSVGGSRGLQIFGTTATAGTTIGMTGQHGVGSSYAINLYDSSFTTVPSAAVAGAITLTANNGDIAFDGGNTTVRNVTLTAGNGSAITLKGRDLDVRTTNSQLVLSTTGALTIEPGPTSTTFGADFTWQGTMSGADLVGTASSGLEGVTVKNYASLGGLTLGRSGSNATISNITLASPVSVSGDVALNGNNLSLNGAVTAGSRLTLNATGSVTQTAAAAADKLLPTTSTLWLPTASATSRWWTWTHWKWAASTPTASPPRGASR